MFLFDKAGKETDGRDVSRRWQVQGKVYVRWGSLEYFVSGGKGARENTRGPGKKGDD